MADCCVELADKYTLDSSSTKGCKDNRWHPSIPQLFRAVR